MTPSNAHETEHLATPGEVLEIDLSLHLSGRLVAATVGKFEKAVRVALRVAPPEIVVDLTGIDFVDPAGQTALLKAHLRGRQRGHPIRFVPAEHEMVRQLAAVTRTDETSD
jgi:anti-anti-sigma factor